ncbi:MULTISPECIES: FadR/GntR family transcriptional regulator [unclassified Pseudoalteromonas]|uniref:FadR/GntR family transcriptional regulator n=1 Tax=unclassified Pseudoalteromonas TaxID=194690 RepID=UPI00235922E3|nr:MULTISPECIES: FadR/GntR family transcriptional regulator [unclassified Pseudoalteromonas]MDC9564919.1 FadR/GntR family transcriptional regulator [Pseudoalteromonas sp. GAB2316C]MDC9569321.1 FadR/GntR family transcriptional regulator [Pseudoalteromonas sp. GABNB9D]MDC9574200.1 FadR/GntR family transcriptional regulator [Pseudoalteromonas sp. GABNS16A]MDC9577724.1 FadR/GntR family transcriptional regulator [Pseudoalteromonas sp. GABNS16E]MDC9585377.1 FadR/GntR family transcriptional regulator|tara:strand:+ start:452 stop:1201 length:750 start_codon:yes stop_codon:yes gene_type:complete
MENRRLFWRIVDKVEALINQGEFSAGSRLPPERELADMFDVSRPTIREAIIALEVRGRVEVKTGSGVYVIEQQETSVKTKEISAFELTQARALIEGEIAALAAQSITDEELAQLKQTLIAMEKGLYVEQADREFHEIIARATRNKALEYAVANLWDLRLNNSQIVADYGSVCKNNNDCVMDEHTAIYNALQTHDASAARTAMHKHFNRLINALFDAVEARALEEIKRKNDEKRGLYSLDGLVKSASKTH